MTRKQIVNHPLLPYPRRLIALDAIYTWRVNQRIKLKATQAQADSIGVMQKITGLSKSRCFAIVTGVSELDDFKVREGFRTIYDKEQK